MNELSVVSSFQHANSVKVHEILEAPDKFFIVTELAKQGDLYQFYKKNDSEPMPENQVKFIAKQLFSVL